jgi:hypothetical protein
MQSFWLIRFQINKFKIFSKIIYSKDEELELVPTSPNQGSPANDHNTRTFDYMPDLGQAITAYILYHLVRQVQ